MHRRREEELPEALQRLIESRKDTPQQAPQILETIDLLEHGTKNHRPGRKLQMLKLPLIKTSRLPTNQKGGELSPSPDANVRSAGHLRMFPSFDHTPVSVRMKSISPNSLTPLYLGVKTRSSFSEVATQVAVLSQGKKPGHSLTLHVPNASQKEKSALAQGLRVYGRQRNSLKDVLNAL